MNVCVRGVRGSRGISLLWDIDSSIVSDGVDGSACRIGFRLVDVAGALLGSDFSDQQQLSDLLIGLGAYVRAKDIDMSIDEVGVLKCLMKIVCESELSLQLRSRAFWAYALMLRCRSGCVAEEALELGHVQIFMQFEQVELLRNVPACLGSIAGHCQQCLDRLLAIIDKRTLERLLQNDETRTDGVNLLLFLAKQTRNGEFHTFVLQAFFQVLSIDLAAGLRGLANFVDVIEEVPPCATELGVFKAVIDGLQSENEAVVEASMRAIGSFARKRLPLPSVQTSWFVKWLRPENEPLCIATLMAISELLHDAHIQDQFRDANLISQIVDLYDDATFVMKEAICLCLATIAEVGTTGDKYALVDAHVIPLFCQILNSSEHTVYRVLTGLSALVTNGWKADGTNICADSLDLDSILALQSHPCAAISDLAHSIAHDITL